VGPRAGLARRGKLALIGIRSPDRQAHTESLFRLSSPGHLVVVVVVVVVVVMIIIIIIIITDLATERLASLLRIRNCLV